MNRTIKQLDEHHKLHNTSIKVLRVAGQYFGIALSTDEYAVK